jgi:hypothetical protein
LDVDEGNVRPQSLGEPHRLVAGGGASDDLQPLSFEQA